MYMCNFYRTATRYLSRHLPIANELFYIAPIAQLVSALDFNFERADEGSILTAGKRLGLKM